MLYWKNVSVFLVPVSLLVARTLWTGWCPSGVTKWYVDVITTVSPIFMPVQEGLDFSLVIFLNWKRQRRF